MNKNAAVVFNHQVRLSEFDIRQVIGLAKHLNAIHKTPQQYWQQLTELLIENEWSVKQTEEICKAIN